MPIQPSRIPRRITLTTTLLILAPWAIWGQTPQVSSVYYFPNINAADEPEGNLLVGKNGSLYGTTYEVPAVFQLVPPTAVVGTWTYNTLAELPFQSIGVGGLTADEKGNLYGADQRDGFGAGRLFELTPPAAAGGSWSFTYLHTFDGSNGDGVTPFAPPIFVNHALLGTTFLGGANGAGVVYVLKRSSSGAWTYHILHTFSGSDGANPEAPLIVDQQGNLYGTASAGGSGGNGVVFELSPPATEGDAWSYQVLHAFTGGSNGDGSEPEAALTLGKDGALYGTTAQGGNTILCNGIENIWDGCGTVFQLTPSPIAGGSWTETILHAFTGYDVGQDGAALLGPVTFGGNGKLYGTTGCGGSENQGVIFALTPPASKGAPWTYEVLVNFDTSFPGMQPRGGLTLGRNGVFFGTTSVVDADFGTQFYYGSVFEFAP